METEIKDAVYTKDQLEGLESDQLKDILNKRNVEYHHMNKDETLIEKIIASNPNSDDADITSENSGNNLSSKVENVTDNNSGIVKLELINSKRTGSLRVRDFTNPQGEKKQLRDKNNDPWVYMITKNVKLDLSDKEDKALYEHLLDHPYVIGGGGLKPSIKLINEGQDSVDNVNLVENAIKAQNIIMGLSEKELRDFARVLGVELAHKKTPVVVKSLCYDLCKEKPDFVIDMWNNPLRELRGLLHKATDHGLITRVDGVMKYDNLSVGTTFEEAVLWFDKNPDILPGMRNKLK
jgi:hypothetical protein